MPEQASISCAALAALVKWASKTVADNFAAEVERTGAIMAGQMALHAAPSSDAPKQVLVSRTALAACYAILKDHTDNCDIQSRAVHLECLAAVAACRQALGLAP